MTFLEVEPQAMNPSRGIRWCAPPPENFGNYNPGSAFQLFPAIILLKVTMCIS